MTACNCDPFPIPSVPAWVFSRPGHSGMILNMTWKVVTKDGKTFPTFLPWPLPVAVYFRVQ